MLSIPAPKFIEQDSATPIANLNTNLIVGNVARVTLDFPVERADMIFLTLSSTVLGGRHNQSFQIGRDAPNLELLIAKPIVEASAGTVVFLQMHMERNSQPYFAETSRVRINSLPIIVPTPTTVWDFSDGTFQGWVPQGPYVGGLLRVANSSLVVDVPNSRATSAHIITRPVPVIAGRTYDCSFVVMGNSATSDGSTLYLTMNGTPIGATVQNITQAQPQTGTGTFTATTTGDVRLGIFNATVPNGNHRLSLGNIRMTPRP
ncbi:carbohydrate binding domain-containing protein [Pseudomonas antarctica]|uniref:carbohydrate binding domain-containing protein n=1 Tax=Pseudomonas antarctica TaxID=219572 RepID=UPI0039C26A2E